MPRPKKWRRVCCLPQVSEFMPVGCICSEAEEILMSVEEFETVRLIDYQNLTQEECAKYMDIARTTVQQIYMDARKKIATSIVEGRMLRINGGDYQLCEDHSKHCGCGNCRRHQFGLTEMSEGGEKEE